MKQVVTISTLTDEIVYRNLLVIEYCIRIVVQREILLSCPGVCMLKFIHRNLQTILPGISNFFEPYGWSLPVNWEVCCVKEHTNQLNLPRLRAAWLWPPTEIWSNLFTALVHFCATAFVHRKAAQDGQDNTTED